MKQQLLSLFGIIIYMSSFAQNNSVKIVSKSTHAVLNGTEYTIYGDGANMDVKEVFYAVMEGQDSMLIGIKRVEKTIMANTADYFCWYLCYSPTNSGTLPNWYAEDSLWMYQNDTIDNFSVYLQPNGLMGQAQYRYVFYPELDPSDSSWVDIKFDIVSVGIRENQEMKVNIYPNPVSSKLFIELPDNAWDKNINLDIYDMNGRLVQSEKVPNKLNEIDINKEWKEGTYIVRLYNTDVIYKEEKIQLMR